MLPLIVAAGLIALAGCFGGAPEPVAGAGKRRWMRRDLRDASEMPLRCLGIPEEPQRDPPGGKGLIDAQAFLRRKGGIAGNPVGDPRLAVVEQLAHQDAALGPPRIGIVNELRIVRRLQHQLGGFADLVVAPKPLDAA